MEHNHRFFTNRECEYFPCHPTNDPDNFNCLFCYCPLYVLDRECGGQFTYTETGVKDCTSCLGPHDPEGFDRILAAWPRLLKLMELRREKDSESSV